MTAEKKEAYLALWNIRSALNVGSLFRTADALGIAEIILVGYTPGPLDRFGRERRAVAKAALGAEKTVPWRRIRRGADALRLLKKKGAFLVAVEQSSRSIDYKKVPRRRPIAFLLGNEVEGLPPRALAAADVVAEIPMRGRKESLNVAVAGGVALFRILGQ